ncbi:YciI family protein [Aquisphaera insulae]|uniref:YciI family protein n=1 Tax=Aquisphaera insulae TaxID=2712864 RepID=UPI0013ED2035|nr:YciI family protein [Aquisphaera insulae]
MRVMVIVKATAESEAGGFPSEQLIRDMDQFNQELAKAGVWLEAGGLKPSSQGARVRFSGKDRIVTDGPFAEAKELIAGFWLWEVGSLQEAIDWVRRCPCPFDADSEIEIRPMFEPGEFDPSDLTDEDREQERRLRAEAKARLRGSSS